MSWGRMARSAWIIPARAGFTCGEGCVPPMGTDHPRSRGVYRTIVRITGRAPGSSPLARGLPRWARGSSDDSGIIPARAGFTAGSRRGAGSETDHPRSRGVYRRRAAMYSVFPGSSPLARGLRLATERAGRVRGIIPARAGFTDGSEVGARDAADHPRSRGVYGSSPTRRRDGGGSSPLARGLPRPLRATI